MTRADVALVAFGTTLLLTIGFGACYLALLPPQGSTTITGAYVLPDKDREELNGS